MSSVENVSKKTISLFIYFFYIFFVKHYGKIGSLSFTKNQSNIISKMLAMKFWLHIVDFWQKFCFLAEIYIFGENGKYLDDILEFGEKKSEKFWNTDTRYGLFFLHA